MCCENIHWAPVAACLQVATYLLHMCHVVVVVAVLHLLWVDIDCLLG